MKMLTCKKQQNIKNSHFYSNPNWYVFLKVSTHPISFSFFFVYPSVIRSIHYGEYCIVNAVFISTWQWHFVTFVTLILGPNVASWPRKKPLHKLGGAFFMLMFSSKYGRKTVDSCLPLLVSLLPKLFGQWKDLLWNFHYSG